MSLLTHEEVSEDDDPGSVQQSGLPRRRFGSLVFMIGPNDDPISENGIRVFLNCSNWQCIKGLTGYRGQSAKCVAALWCVESTNAAVSTRVSERFSSQVPEQEVAVRRDPRVN